MIQLDVLKHLPGNWQIHINDSDSKQRWQTLSFTVDTYPEFNQPPTARIAVARTGTANRIQVKVVANDAENDRISVLWSPQEAPEILPDDGISGWKTLYLTHSGTHSFFIEINDDNTRYPGSGSTTSAGEGFRTLLRLDVTPSFRGDNMIKVTSSNLNSYHGSATKLLTFYRSNSPVYEPSSSWPAPYNGVTPPNSANMHINNIAVLDTSNTTLHSCVRIVKNGMPDNLDGIERFDINFSVLDLATGLIQVADIRAFNTAGALNENFELPDCSGQFDLNTNVYSDLIMVDGQVFDTGFGLSNAENLTFSLTSANAAP